MELSNQIPSRQPLTAPVDPPEGSQDLQSYITRKGRYLPYFSFYSCCMSINVLHISNSDKIGGAQRAAYWLSRGLKSEGMNIIYLVQDKISTENWIHQISSTSSWRKYTSLFLEKIVLLPYIFKKKRAWSNNFISRLPFSKLLKHYNPKIVNLHWVGGGFVSLNSIRSIKIPIVISMYDMWFFTGGCHYSSTCFNYHSLCKKCPHLSSSFAFDLSSINYILKHSLFQNFSSVTFVAPSAWLADEAKKSAILNKSKIAIIPHGTDCSIYKPVKKDQAQFKLKLSQSFKYILFASTGGLLDKRKGFQYLAKAINSLPYAGYSNVKLLILGPDDPKTCNIPINLDYVSLDPVSDDETLSLIYSACTLVATPSDQEAFGMTASESLCCGTPVVAFAHYGPLDVIDHKSTGYLAKPYDHIDLAKGIEFILKKSEISNISKVCREQALKRFSLQSVSKQYSNLYAEILSR